MNSLLHLPRASAHAGRTPRLRRFGVLFVLLMTAVLLACGGDGVVVEPGQADATPARSDSDDSAATGSTGNSGGSTDEIAVGEDDLGPSDGELPLDTDDSGSDDIFEADDTAALPTEPPPTPTPVPLEPFRIDGPNIIDPFGEPFLPVGTNVSAAWYPYTSWASDVIAGQDFYIDTWNFNTLRLNVFCLDKTVGQPCELGIANGNIQVATGFEDVDEIIEAYRSTGVVIIIDYHPVDFPFVPTADQISVAVDYFTEMATKHKDNPYVWFELFNEPLNECNFGNHGEGLDQSRGQGNASPTWLDIHVPLIEAIRGTGAQNPIMLNASNWGQDFCDRDGGPWSVGKSSILSFGPGLVAQYDNILFDMHFYSRWASERNNSDDDIRAYFDAIHDAGLAVVVGEIGGKLESTKVHADDLIAAERFYNLRIPGVGALSWHASFGFPPVTENGGVVDVDRTDGEKPGNLTPTGSLHWDYAQNPPSAIPGG